MKDWLDTWWPLIVGISAIFFVVTLVYFVPTKPATCNIVELNWDGCQYLRFAGNERILIHKANCTNAVHWK